MNKEEVKERIHELTESINYHNHRYYLLSDPEISDYDFDMLLEELIRLEEEHPESAQLPNRNTYAQERAEYRKT